MANPKPLFIPLKGKHYDSFALGTKTIEYRPYGRRWNALTCAQGRQVILSRGYGRHHRMYGEILCTRIIIPILAPPEVIEIYRDSLPEKFIAIHIAVQLPSP